MSIAAIRFRTDGELVVLQVLQIARRTSNHYLAEDKAEWRDAKVTDLLNVSKFTESDFGQRLDQLSQRIGQVENSVLLGGHP